MNENNILEIFYKWLDGKKIEDMNSFLSVRRVNSFIEMLENRYKSKDENDMLKEFKTMIYGAFYDLQEYYFIQGYKANTELREQLQRLIDKN